MRSTEAIGALGALAHEHRLNVFRLLVEVGPEGLSAGIIAQRLKLPPSSLTFHLQHLQRAGLISQQRMSRQLIYAADFAAVAELVTFLTENCCAQSATKADCAVECAAPPRSSRSQKWRRSA